MIFGEASVVRDASERTRALRVITEHLIPGRWDGAREPNKKELAATAVLSVPLAEASVKSRSGGPIDEEEDLSLDFWSGVIPVRMAFGDPEPDSTVPVPEHIYARAGHTLRA
jgi:hypothetical protein